MLKYGLAYCAYVENNEFAHIKIRFSELFNEMKLYDSYNVDSWHFFKPLPRLLYITHDNQIVDNIINQCENTTFRFIHSVD